MLVIEYKNKRLTFIHGPRTAGVSLQWILFQAMASKFRDLHINEINDQTHQIKDGKLIELNSIVDSDKLVTCHSYQGLLDGISLVHVPRRLCTKFFVPSKSPFQYIYITTVRNPYDRLYSAYLQSGFDKAEFNSFVQKELPRTLLRFYRDYNRGKHHFPKLVGFAPLWMALANEKGYVRFDYIIRTETFEVDVKSMLSKLDLPISDLMNFNKLEHNKDADLASTSNTSTNVLYKPYSSLIHYDFRSLFIVEALYIKDFELFGYRRLSRELR